MIDRHYVAQEGGLAEGSGLFGIVCVVNVASRDEVDHALQEVTAAGGTVTSPPRFRDGGCTASISRIRTAIPGRWSGIQRCQPARTLADDVARRALLLLPGKQQATGKGATSGGGQSNFRVAGNLSVSAFSPELNTGLP